MDPTIQAEPWFESGGRVLALARWLVNEHRIDTVQGLLDYFSKPWKWTDEWHEMIESTLGPVVTTQLTCSEAAREAFRALDSIDQDHEG